MSKFICRGGEIFLSAEMVDERPTLAWAVPLLAYVVHLEICVSAVVAVSVTRQIKAINLNEKSLLSAINVREFVLVTLVHKRKIIT